MDRNDFFIKKVYYQFAHLWNLDFLGPNMHHVLSKETKLERADFTRQLLMFVTAEKERQMLFIIFLLSSFCQLLSPQF